MSHDSFECGGGRSSLNVYVHTVVGSEPREYKFHVIYDAWVAATLIALEGIDRASPVETSAVLRMVSNPYTAPTPANGGRNAYGIASFMQVRQPGTTYSIPRGTTRLAEANGIAIFSALVAPGAKFEVEPVTASNDACGFAHAALLRLP